MILRRACVFGVSLFIEAAVLAGCASTKPCSKSGNFRWPTPVKGDVQCIQKKQKDGRFINEGDYRILSKNGRVALQGQMLEGEMDGLWTEYNDSGKKSGERYFEKGIEKAAPLPK